MIIAKTPLRISFFSGGSDLPSFYEHDIGAALSVTINKFIYVFVNHNTNDKIRTMYESVEDIPELHLMQDGITKEVLKYHNFNEPITIGSVSDIPSGGSGLGSSSAFTISLLIAMDSYLSPIKKTLFTNKDRLAELACEIEMRLFPVGKQDQYASTFGGMNLFTFSSTKVERVSLFQPYDLDLLESNLLLVHSGRSRSANAILQKQQEAMADPEKFKRVAQNRDKAYLGKELIESRKYDDFGLLLHESWLDKKSLVKEISQSYFDMVYDKAIDAGALGGKLLGAGGGGFFLFYVPKEYRENVIREITTNTECKIFDFNFYSKGCSIITY